MSNLFAKLTNLFDQDFMSFEEGKPIFDWLNKHKEDINSIEKSYLDDFKQLKQQLEEKDKELLEFKRNKLYFELLITRLQWLHKKADEYKEEKERFGIDEEISLSSVWDVLSLQKNNICEYEEMCELQEGIECIANSRLLKDIEHDLQIKVTRKEDEIFKDIEQVEVTKQQLAEKDIRIEELEGQFAYECECNMQLVDLQKQLEEKQKTIDEINKEFVQAVHDWKALCAEKDNEIEKLKQQYTILENENGKLTTELIMDKYKKAQKEVSFGKQLAIQELEKVKAWLEPKYFDYEQINYLTRIIDNQIKELKGE